MKNWTKVFALAAFVAIGSIALATSAYGQLQFPPIPSHCIIIADEVVIILKDDPKNPRTFVSTGTMDLDPGQSFPSDANNPAKMELKNRSFSAQSQDPVLGTVTWDLDVTRPITSSNIRANQVTALFPATVILNFHVRATISTLRGRVFLSRTPITITNSGVRSWPPGEIDLNSVEGTTVDFYDQATNQTVFTMILLRSRVRD